jgi:hypothetical protein
MNAKEDYKFIHIGYEGEKTHCGQTMGIQVDRETKKKCLYCYRCGTRIYDSKLLK